MRHATPPGECSRSGRARARSPRWRCSGLEVSRRRASPVLAERLAREGLEVVQAWTPPMPAADASCEVLYADQVLEHMSGIDAARAFVAEALRVLRPAASSSSSCPTT